MKFAMIASHYVPIRDASSLRIHSYCKSLAEAGHQVSVLIVYPSLTDIPKSGNFEGVNYHYISPKSYYTRNILYKFFYRLSGLLFIRKFTRKNKIDAILSYHDNILTNCFLKFFVSFTSVPYIIDKTEYPYGYFNKSWLQKKIIDFNLRLFSGIIVITKELKTFYSRFSSSIFLLPMTIAPDRFQGISKTPSPYPYIALTFGTHNRDGLFESVIAYNSYCKLIQDSPFLLYLVGDFEKLCEKFPACLGIRTYIHENGLDNYVQILGKQPIDTVPTILISANCLLTTPAKFSSGGFPTKLGEYLLSSVPVVATNAGEISDYVTNGYDILLSKVGDLDDVAKNILFVHQHPKEANIIGKNGMRTAKEKFNAATYTDALVKFIISLKEMK
ncbi:hypothetical protein A8C56_08015 [Niabella ginsenosidivorans]|uniref:Glycosyl transferase family 1 domain-containing protein n=1 Tax=Niabella ginsenosidivorans TaxID=1176587 RepID=A0A1A9I0T1_9BACT|nr:glycosyltransferase [Niabella ginsenosidivorans]ANH80935.1 hypothetical protein A8C56_08015 [Niabella ginsenosidivorans]